jgi:hypothetical protein
LSLLQSAPEKTISQRWDSARQGFPHFWRRLFRWGSSLAAIAILFACFPSVAGAAAVQKDPGRWNLVSTTSIRIFYYQGMTQDNRGHFYFDGVDNGLFVTDSSFSQIAGTTPYIPAGVTARDKYNHIGAIAFSKNAGVLLPMECYDEATDANCANTGAIGVAAPVTLAWKYEVKLDPATIKKAMWAAVSPNGKLLWTSAGNNLLAYSMADMSPSHSWPTHAAIAPLRILKNAVPASGVDGGAFYQGRLYLAGSVGNTKQVWSVDTSNGSRRLEISRTVVGEQEGIDFLSQDGGKVHPVALCADPSCGAATHYTTNSFGGTLHLMVMPQPSGKTPPTYAAATILSFDPHS